MHSFLSLILNPLKAHFLKGTTNNTSSLFSPSSGPTFTNGLTTGNSYFFNSPLFQRNLPHRSIPEIVLDTLKKIMIVIIIGNDSLLLDLIGLSPI